MKTYFSKETTSDLSNKFDFLGDLSASISKHSFGNGVGSVFICLHSLDPDFGIGQDFETGLVIQKKYVKSKKTLEFKYKINHKEISESTTRGGQAFIVLEGLKKTYSDIKALNIKDFDIDRFYNTLELAIKEFTHSEYTPTERFFEYMPQRDRSLLSREIKPLKEVVFWELIDQAKEQSKNFVQFTNTLVDKLCQFNEKQIIGFEYAFRDALSKSAHYNVMALLKIKSNYVSDDSFLFFRCRLLAEGKDFYHKVIDNPDFFLESNIEEHETGGEELLTIADQSFIKKYGEGTEKELPRSVALDYLNYDDGEEIRGEDWKEEELPFKFPNLWKRYNIESHG